MIFRDAGYSRLHNDTQYCAEVLGLLQPAYGRVISKVLSLWASRPPGFLLKPPQYLYKKVFRSSLPGYTINTMAKIMIMLNTMVLRRF